MPVEGTAKMPWSGTTKEPISATAESSASSALDRILSKTVPVWFVAAIILFSALGAVAFGWYVKRSLYLSDGHPIARAAIAVASFPTDVKTVFLEIREHLSGGAGYRFVRVALPRKQLSNFAPVKSQPGTAVKGLMVRHGPGEAARGWRVIIGGFRINGSIEDAAILLSPDLEIVHHWLLAEDGPINAKPDPPSAGLTHGFSLLKDGSVIYNFYGGDALRRKDSCGRTVWSTAGNYHHSVALDDTETSVWTLREDSGGDPAERNKIVQVAVDDGEIEQEFSVADIIAANPSIDVLELRRRHEDAFNRNRPSLPGQWLRDPFHLNDVDPLPRSLASSFPLFAAGDLAISARELNLIFVLDPATLAIKWWHVGATIRQHDPDWMTNGHLAVFNNRMTRSYSEIVEIDPATRVKTVAIDGRRLDFYSRAGGNQQATPGGGWLFTSAAQGVVTELSAGGDVALEFYSLLSDEEPIVGLISETIFLHEEALDMDSFRCGED